MVQPNSNTTKKTENTELESAFGALETSSTLTPALIDQTARELLSKLTLDEKISMMSGNTPFFTGLWNMLRNGYFRQPRTTAGAIARLGIPGVRFSDGPRGFHGAGATTFPQASARGASWDPGLEERVGKAMGREARAQGSNMIGAPCINLARHPAWGRAQEGYGEDPFLLGQMGAALVRGIQHHVMSCPKHFALNSMENSRFKLNVTVDTRALHEIYLPHFKRVVDEGAATIMSAYNSVNGEWASQNEQLLTGILQDDWGFEGFVQSDWLFAVRDAKKAALAGQHLEMPFANVYHRFLPELIDDGEVSETVIDDAAFRILRQLVRFAQGRDPHNYTPEVIGCEEHQKLAREVEQKSIIMLKNDEAVLPLRNVSDVTIFGHLADTPNLGDYGSSMTQPPHVVTPLQGLHAAQDARFRIQYEEGTDLERAAVAAKFCDVAIVVVGYTFRDEGEYLSPATAGAWTDHFPKIPSPEDTPMALKLMEISQELGTPFSGIGGDRNSLNPRPEDEALIHAVANVNPRTVVVIMAGSTVLMESWREKVAGILLIGYPGQEGGHALADVLLGKVNPSGKLTNVIPKNEDDLPFFDKEAEEITYGLWHGYRLLERDGVEPAYPFGFGLSYTTFKLTNLQIAENTINQDGQILASVNLTNTGDVAGAEVLQLYVSAKNSKVERAPKELKAFTKIYLEPGEVREIKLSVPASELAYYDKGWIVEPGKYEVIVGRHSLDEEALSAEVVIK